MNRLTEKRKTGLSSKLIRTIIFVVVFFAGCTPSEASPTPAPFSMSVTPATSVPVIDPPVVEQTETLPAATAVPQVIASTTTPRPPTVTPLPSATPAGQLGPDTFPIDVNPLTGLQLSDPVVLEQRPVAIKISNFPDCVRPQDGIARADIVFEHYAEGGTTRFTALYLSQGAAQIGSVRSARMIDLEIPAMYQAMFGFSGASGGVKLRLEESDFFERIISPDFEPGHPAFYRKPIADIVCELAEHTLFTGTDRLWTTTTERGLNERTEVLGTAFNAAIPAGGQPALELIVRYTASFVYWNYNVDAGVYFRSNNGATHRDGLDGQPVSAANVIVLLANHLTTDIIEDFVGYNRTTGEGGNYSVEIQIWGGGRALLFRDGQVFDINWSRWERNRPFVFTDSEGNLVPLKPGVTWYQLAASETPVEQLSPGVWRFTPPRPSSGPSFLTPNP